MQTFKDDDDIIHKANDTFYGLAAAVFSRDISHALSTAKKLHAGTVWVNCASTAYFSAPAYTC